MKLNEIDKSYRFKTGQKIVEFMNSAIDTILPSINVWV